MFRFKSLKNQIGAATTEWAGVALIAIVAIDATGTIGSGAELGFSMVANQSSVQAVTNNNDGNGNGNPTDNGAAGWGMENGMGGGSTETMSTAFNPPADGQMVP